MDLELKRVLVLGGGMSGISAACLALEKKASVVLLDGSTSEAVADRLAPLRDRGAEVLTGERALCWQGRADLVIYSPGIPLGSPLDLVGQATGAPRWSELAFGAEFLDAPLLAVTGTNGKTTSVEMLQHSLKAAGYQSIAAGNIGLPLSEVALMGRKFDYIVTEVSSFQMEHPGNFAPKAAAVLNLTPDHLDRHGSPENYVASKMSVFQNAKTRAVMNAAIVRGKAKYLPAAIPENCLTFSADDSLGADYTVRDGALVRDYHNGKTKVLLKVSQLSWGNARHNLENALAVLCLEEAAGLAPEELALFLVTFQVGPHRLQTVAEFDGYSFIDDSKATDVDAMMSALETMGAQGRPIALIAGGLNKGCELTEAQGLLKKYVRHVSLIGSCREALARQWGSFLSVKVCKDMEEAVLAAVSALPGGGIVLLSPGCASMDMFRNYEERGNFFKKAVFHLRNLKN